MTMVVGIAPDGPDVGALHLAAMLSGTRGDDVVLCSVVPTPWVPGMARIDAEYQAALDQVADNALRRARSRLPDAIDAVLVRHAARSVPAGLLQTAEAHDGDLLVVGSSTAGALGRIALGSVTDSLLHSSPLSIAIAPRGFRRRAGMRVRRVSAAYAVSESGEELIVAAGALAAAIGATLRLVSFAVWSRPEYPTRLGTDSEDPVLLEWLRQVEETATEALARVGGLPEVPQEINAVVGRGRTWADAIEDVAWDEGDLLVVGSSSTGPLARVFLGSRAAKVVRHSPVPVVVVPRRRAAALAAAAEQAAPGHAVP